MTQPALDGGKLSQEGFLDVAEFPEPEVQRRVELSKHANIGCPELKSSKLVLQASLSIRGIALGQEQDALGEEVEASFRILTDGLRPGGTGPHGQQAYRPVCRFCFLTISIVGDGLVLVAPILVFQTL